MSAQKFRYFCQPPTDSGSDTPYGNNTAIGRYQQSDDAKLYYEVYGEGKPLLILHGGGVGCPYEMGALIDKLRPTFQIITIYSRGHGRSEIGHKPLTYEQKALDIKAVMDTVTKEPAIVVGFSDGAFSAYKYASMFPDAVERLVGMGAGTLKPGFFDPDMPVPFLEQLDKAYIDQMRSVMPEPNRLQEFLTAYMSFFSKLSVSTDLFASIKCPVLLIVGDEDDHAPISTVIEAHHAIPNSRLCVVPSAGHPAFLQNLDMVYSAIAPFVSAPLASLVPSKKPSELNAKTVQADNLLVTTTSWDGATLPPYPTKQPQLRTRHFVLPPHSVLSPHYHTHMSVGVVLRGALTLIKKDGPTKTYVKGQSFAETVNTIHKGENRLDEPTELIVFYVWEEDAPLSIPAEM